MKEPLIEYSPARFDEGYYMRGERGGFKNYEFADVEQQNQLRQKWDYCTQVDHQSALFVGCARGFEVAAWRNGGKPAWGVDVSQWAIDNCHPNAKGTCCVFNGMDIPGGDSSYDLVCAFDVLTLVPMEMLRKLVADMVRVAKRAIVIRTIVKDWRNMGADIDGLDGVHYRMHTFAFWDMAFTESGKFKLDHAKTHSQYETMFLWRRV